MHLCSGLFRSSPIRMWRYIAVKGIHFHFLSIVWSVFAASSTLHMRTRDRRAHVSYHCMYTVLLILDQFANELVKDEVMMLHRTHFSQPPGAAAAHVTWKTAVQKASQFHVWFTWTHITSYSFDRGARDVRSCPSDTILNWGTRNQSATGILVRKITYKFSSTCIAVGSFTVCLLDDSLKEEFLISH